MKKTHAFLFALLITILIAVNISVVKTIYSDNNLETVKITRIIDGDTLELEDGRKIRLANINSLEKGQNQFKLSINYLKTFENSSVELEILGIEKYGRILGRIYTPDYLNLELVKQGFASKFLVNEKELKEFASAEEQAVSSQKGIWKKSKHFNCFKIDIDKTNEKILLISNCNNINIGSWLLKDESTRHYIFKNIEIGEITLHTLAGEDNETDIFWNSKTNIWNNNRDSLYLFDKEGYLAYYETYGY